MSKEMKEIILGHLDLWTKLILYDDPFWHRAVIEHLSHNLDRGLRRFAGNARELRDKLRMHEGVLTGEFPLWYIIQQPEKWELHTLEIVVPISGFRQVVEYLENMDRTKTTIGAVREPKRTLKPAAFHEWRHIAYGTESILVYQSADDALSALPSHTGTHLMNGITADLAVVLYPAVIMQGYAVYPTVRINNYILDKLEEYSEYGIRGVVSGAVIEDMRGGCRGSVLCSKTSRRVGDMESMVIQIGRGNREEDFQRIRNSTITWRLGGRGCENSECYLPMDDTWGTLPLGEVEWE